MPSLEELAHELATLKDRVTRLEEAAAPSRRTSPEFDIFWSLYPRKVGKNYALKAWNGLSTADRTAALEGLKTFATIWALAADDRKTFCPHPTTWLRGSRWLDGPAEWRRAAGLKPHQITLQHNHSPRLIDTQSPEWVREVNRLITDPSRPPVDDELFAAYLEWRNERLPPNYVPADWQERLVHPEAS